MSTLYTLPLIIGDNMTLLQKIFTNLSSFMTVGSFQLQGHDELSQQDALDAIDILLLYKNTVHEFTDGIIEYWSLPQRIMERYQFDDAEQLNEWLDNLS